MTSPPATTDVVIPALLRAARRVYADAVRSRLVAGDFDDLPRNGAFVLGGMARTGSASELMQQLGVSKQAASQLIDTLVIRGYLARQINPEDRRRMTLELTQHGRAAAAVVREGVESVDAQLALRISPAELAGFRAVMEAICLIGEPLREDR